LFINLDIGFSGSNRNYFLDAFLSTQNEGFPSGVSLFRGSVSGANKTCADGGSLNSTAPGCCVAIGCGSRNYSALSTTNTATVSPSANKNFCD